MGKHRREVLSKVACIYKAEKEEFYQKYRYFQLHKWEILRVVKDRMLKQKLQVADLSRRLRLWIVHAKLQEILTTMWQRFDRERFMIVHRAKMFPIYLRIKSKFRKRILKFGKTYEQRTRKNIRFSTMAIQAGCCRPLLRERAKKKLLEFLQDDSEKRFMIAKFQKFLQRIILTQRVIGLRLRIKKNTPFEWQKVEKQDCTDIRLASQGLLMLVQAVFYSNVKKQK